MTTAAVWTIFGGLWLGALVPTGWPTAVVGIVLVGLGAALTAGRLRLTVIAVAVVAVGSGLAGGRVELLEHGALVDLARDGGTAELVATVATEARPSKDGAWLLLRVQTVNGHRSGHRAVVRVESLVTAPELGSRVRFRSSGRPLDHDGFDAHLRRLHTAVQLSPVGDLEVIAAPPRLLRATTVVRLRVRAASARHLAPDHAALLSGLVTGDTVGLSEQAEEALLASGLTHLVAVSGSNVALVLAGAVGAAALCGLGVRGRRRVAFAAAVWFAVLTRGEPSVLRATVMALLVLAAQSLGRGHDARHTLAVAGLLLLLLDPLLAGQLGFSLSVLATAGVLVVGPLIAERLPGPRSLAILGGATVGAQVGVAPVLVATEGGVPLGALPANLVAVPAAAAASVVGIAAALIAQLSVPLGGAASVLATPGLWAVLWAGRTFAALPALSPGHLLTPAAALIGATLLARRRAPWLAPIAVVVVAVSAVGVPWAAPPAVTTLSLTALDVGQGDAMLVEVPGSPPARMLVDAGPDETAALAALRRRGVTALDVVVVSHPHADHTNGLPAVLTRVQAGALVTGPDPPRELDEPAASAIATEVVAAQQGVPLLRVSAGQQFPLGAAVVQVLSPPADGSLGGEPNDNSLVLRVISSDGAILLTGDAEVAAQMRLLRRPDLLRAEILKVPHHGGNTNAPGFIEAVGAHTAVIGVGGDNTFGHPDPEVLAKLTDLSVLRTDADGSVVAALQ